ncbi:MAG: hypothetical protein NZ750_12475 [Anaerolineae bacterium]|nr:hypothetical protein [Anaerolineae bacterium]MDW8171278.1 hypothetical protein [Anaerolineae bacterium]
MDSLPAHRLNFVASMTVCASDIRKIKQHLQIANPTFDPLQHILVTPHFMNQEAMKLIRELGQEGRSVTFDSGGYYVQTGRVSYEDLFYPLLQIYHENMWAETYILPDYVPTSHDDKATVQYKVETTARTSKLFYECLDDTLKPRAMPVVHGHTTKQIDLCLDTYIGMGVKKIGFGSFGTMGVKREVNVATQNAVSLASYVIRVAHQHGIKVHIFGLGVPAIVAMLKGIGADYFDSSSWLKSAGFGQVFMPFMRSYNITYKSVFSQLQRGIREHDFEMLKTMTCHCCAMCRDLAKLRSNKMYRAIHNLIALSESVERINHGNLDAVYAIYQSGSKKYREEALKWLPKN